VLDAVAIMSLPMKEVIKRYPVVTALAYLSAVSVGLFFVGVIFYGTTKFWFLNWNLFLAWLPLLFAWLLTKFLKHGRWLSWQGIVLSFLWLGFLPNSFYIISDLVHLQLASAATALYYTVLILSFGINGLLLGYTSLYLLHKEFEARVGKDYAAVFASIVLLLCSFAIYLGRYLRWNTWDVLVNPAGVLFDVSDRIINPAAHELTFRITLLLFILLGSLYIVARQFVSALRGMDHE